MGDVNRRDVLQSLAAVPAFATFAAVPAGPSVAKPSGLEPIRLACASSRSSGGLADEAHGLCRRIERLSGGTIAVRLIEGCEEPFAMLEADEADAVFGYESDKAALHPAFAYFAGVPGNFSMPSPLIDGWLSSQSCTKLWDELSAEFGFKTLYAGHTNTCATLWSSTPLERLHDLTDRSFNCIGLAADIVQGIGGGQTRRALLDVAAPAEVVVCPTAADALGSGLARSRRFVAHTTLSGYGSALTITFARSTWNRMPIGERTLLSLTVQRLRTSKDSQCRTLIQAADEPILRALAKARQVIVYQLPSEIRSAIENVAAAVIADNAAFDSHSRAINTAYFQHRSQFGHHFSQVGV